MQKTALYLFSRTPVHVGAGNSVGAVDAPVMRERHTRIPIIPGTSLKGVLADLWSDEANVEKVTKGNREEWQRRSGSEIEWLFGQSEDKAQDKKAAAGVLLVGEARVLCFPVRSAKGGFAWITCPLALARFKRDTGARLEVPPESAEGQCLAGAEVTLGGKVVLEEYCFDTAGTIPADVADALNNVIDDPVWREVGKRLVVLSDELFSYFVEHACEVVTRVRIDDDTGTVAQGALFNQEQVPSETLFYAVVAAVDKRKNGKTEEGSARQALEALAGRLSAPEVGHLLQVGGDETVGLGCCSAALDTRRA